MSRLCHPVVLEGRARTGGGNALPVGSRLNAGRGCTIAHGHPGRALLLILGILPVLAARIAPALGAGEAISWTEEFLDDPLAAGRFSVPPDHVDGRFTYDPGGHFVTVHYDTLLPTAWYMRPLDPAGERTLGRYDDFEFAVTFRVRSEGFEADPNGFAQIAWGLVNSKTTGDDRAGGSGGPYAFDCVTFDFFPNVSPLFGGPTLGPTIIHSDDGSGFFANIEFSFGAETTIDTDFGDETVELDAVYTARVVYDGADQVATLRLYEGERAMHVNADGAGGPGGFDGDPTTIQTFVLIDNAFAVDAFALTAWQDTFSPYYASVVADVDVMRIEFHAAAFVMGDINRDGLLDGRDTQGFVDLLLSPAPEGGLIARGDFNGDGVVDLDDLEAFVGALLE